MGYNLELSQHRAEVVAQALVQRFGIDARCLAAKGVGPLTPLASNDQEAGRAKNRRVALVKQQKKDDESNPIASEKQIRSKSENGYPLRG